MADPTRRALLQLLARGPAAVRDLARPFRMSQQAVSKHLACLERAGLVRKQRRGRLHVCSLVPEPLAQVAAWSEQCRKTWETNFARLDDVLHDLETRDAARPPKKEPDR